MLSTNFATRGVLERERHAATNVLCRGRIPKQEPQKIPNTIISIMISELPPTATFQTYVKENKLCELTEIILTTLDKKYTLYMHMLTVTVNYKITRIFQQEIN